MKGGSKPSLKPFGSSPTPSGASNHFIPTEFEKLKRLEAFCAAELRTKLGILQTSLLLYAEENPRPESEIDHLVFQGLDALKQTIRRLEDVNRDNQSEIKMIWEMTRNPQVQPRRDLPHDFYSVVLSQPEDLVLRLNDYVPHAIIIRSDLFSEIPKIFKNIEISKIPYVFTHGPNPPQELLSLAHQSFEGHIDLQVICEWMFQAGNR